MNKRDRDKDGYLVLIPKMRGSVARAPFRYGSYNLVRIKNTSDRGSKINSRRYTIGIDDNGSYETEFGANAWQRKAWKLISVGLKVDTAKPIFEKTKGVETRTKHIIRMGVALKVKATDPISGDPSTNNPILDQIVSSDNPYGIYQVATDKASFRELFEDIYYMMYIKRDNYLKTLKAIGYIHAVYIMKAFIVYDDHSFDAFSGDPRNMFEYLGIKFTDDGKVKI